jgi:oxygen-dependent protoporphyrinogen oxidase
VFSSPVGDRLVDAGPDAFLARVEHGVELCRDLGLEDRLTSPAATVPAYVYTDDTLHELPSGTMFGVPTDLDELRTAGLISPAGVDRAAADLDRDWAGVGTGDCSVGEVCRERLGDEITDRLIDPLLGAINASDIDRLSLRAAAPQLAAALDEHRSLIRGMATVRARADRSGAAIGNRDPDRPVFHGLPGGTATIIDRLVDALRRGGADLRRNSPITTTDAFDGADAVVLAVPAFTAARILGSATDAGAILAQTAYADVTQVVAELPIDSIDRVLDASGILFPRVDGRLMTACTWLSSKWAHYRRDDSVLVRLSTGRFGDERHKALADEELVAALLAELSEAVPVTGPPRAVRVGRWERAFPQYTPGHRERVAAARAAVADLDPRVTLIGASYDGIGVPACIAAGRAAARSLLHR